MGLPCWLVVKNLPAIQETWVRSLGREDPLEEEMPIHASIHAWKIPWTEEPGGYHPWGQKESDMTGRVSMSASIPLSKWATSSLSTPPADGHLCCFHVLAVVNSAAMNIGIHVSFWMTVLSSYMPRSGIAGSYGNSIFSFLRNFIQFSTVAAPIYIPIIVKEGFLFSTPFPASIVCRLFKWWPFWLVWGGASLSFWFVFL